MAKNKKTKLVWTVVVKVHNRKPNRRAADFYFTKDQELQTDWPWNSGWAEKTRAWEMTARAPEQEDRDRQSQRERAVEQTLAWDQTGNKKQKSVKQCPQTWSSLILHWWIYYKCTHLKVWMTSYIVKLKKTKMIFPNILFIKKSYCN